MSLSTFMAKAINGGWCDVATTGFWPVKNRLKSVIDYAENPDKTTELKGVDKDFMYLLSTARSNELMNV